MYGHLDSCDLKQGDGLSSREIKMRDTSTTSECISLCAQAKTKHPAINGVTVSFNPGHVLCYCEISMNGRTDNRNWQSCWLEPSKVKNKCYQGSLLNL